MLSDKIIIGHFIGLVEIEPKWNVKHFVSQLAQSPKYVEIEPKWNVKCYLPVEGRFFTSRNRTKVEC